jgi:hypothetical protein
MSASWGQGMGLILDGIRSLAVANEFRRLVAPTPFLLTYIETQDPVREARYSARPASSETTLREVETHSMEQESARALPQVSDILVRGDMKLNDEVASVTKRIYELCGPRRSHREVLGV